MGMFLRLWGFMGKSRAPGREEREGDWGFMDRGWYWKTDGLNISISIY
jgi:hypothetical protein